MSRVKHSVPGFGGGEVGGCRVGEAEVDLAWSAPAQCLVLRMLLTLRQMALRARAAGSFGCLRADVGSSGREALKRANRSD